MYFIVVLLYSATERLTNASDWLFD